MPSETAGKPRCDTGSRRSLGIAFFSALSASWPHRSQRLAGASSPRRRGPLSFDPGAVLPHRLPSRALRAALWPRDARPLRLRRPSRSLTLAATVLNVFNEMIACACLALASGIALAPPRPFWMDAVLRQRPHRRRCAPRLRTRRVRPRPSLRSPCSLTLAPAVPGGSRWRFPAKLHGSVGTGNRHTIRNPCSTFASPMRGSAMLRLRRSPRPLSPAPTVTSASTEMIVRRSRARLRRRAGARPLSSGPDRVLRQRPHRRRCAPRLRTCRVRPLQRHRSPCSLTLAATVPGGSRWRFPAELQGSAGTGNRPTIRKPCSTFASAMHGSAMLRLRRSPRPLSPASTVTSASTEMNVWRSRARLRHRARNSAALLARRSAAATSASPALRAALADFAVSNLSDVTGRHAR